MKRRNAIIRPGGALLWSTTAILAGLGLSGCQRNDYVATAKDQQMAETQKRIEELDAQKTKLMGGEVPNNFFIQGVGYYHAAARDFFQHPYGFSHEGKWFVDGRWQATAPVETVAASKPVPEALKKVEAALQKEQQLMAGQSGAGATHSNGGFGMGNALLMYWLLAGNRGGFMPGAGFQRAAAQAPAWQGEVERQRSAVSGYAASNPGYRRMVEQSKASGAPVRTGQSVRGGFGSSRSGGGAFSSGG